ncbi:hypothetical protein BJV77DRAFT_1151920 [Russula vinacea]|nr:hypothetical protein BJV77DRAFT_1151920 [Russula vinacea]
MIRRCRCSTGRNDNMPGPGSERKIAVQERISGISLRTVPKCKRLEHLIKCVSETHLRFSRDLLGLLSSSRGQTRKTRVPIGVECETRESSSLERIGYHAAVQTSPTADVILIAKMRETSGQTNVSQISERTTGKGYSVTGTLPLIIEGCYLAGIRDTACISGIMRSGRGPNCVASLPLEKLNRGMIEWGEEMMDTSTWGSEFPT